MGNTTFVKHWIFEFWLREFVLIFILNKKNICCSGDNFKMKHRICIFSSYAKYSFKKHVKLAKKIKVKTYLVVQIVEWPAACLSTFWIDKSFFWFFEYQKCQATSSRVLTSMCEKKSLHFITIHFQRGEEIVPPTLSGTIYKQRKK